MARTRNLQVTVTGDASSLNRALNGASRDLDKFGKQTSLHARVSSKGFSGVAVAAKGASAAVGGLAVGAGYLIKQYEESAKVGRQTNAVLKSTHHEAGLTAKEIGNLATKISQKTGIDDEAVQSAENLLLTFTNLRNETGKGNDIFTQSTKIVTDMSVALGQDMKSSAVQVGKALNDPIKGITALQRVGVSFTAKQKEQIKTLVDSGKTMDAQKLILRELNKEFGGSAAAAATPFDKLKVSVGNLAETAGGVLAPAAGKAAGALNKFIIQMQNGTGAGGRFATALTQAFGATKTYVVNAVHTIREAISNFVDKNRSDINSFVSAVRNIGRIVQAIFNGIVIPTVRRMLPAFKQVFEGVTTVIRGAVRIISGILTGNFSKVWDGVKDIFSGGIKAAIGTIRLQTAPARELASKIGRAIIDGVKSAIEAGKGAIASAIRSLIPGPVRGILNKAGGAGKSLLNSVGLATGGRVSGPAGAGDVVPAMLSPGEVVLNSRQQDMIGRDAIYGALRATGGKMVGLASGGVIGPAAVSRMQSVGASIGARGTPYVYGGGHGSFNDPRGYDCSGYVSAILGSAGVISSPMAVRYPLQDSLVPGPGKFVTVGIRGTAGKSAHTMIKVGNRYFESGSGHGAREVGGWSGAFDFFHPANEATSTGAAASSSGNPGGSARSRKPGATMGTGSGNIPGIATVTGSTISEVQGASFTDTTDHSQDGAQEASDSEYLQSLATQASFTPGNEDDIAAASKAVGYYQAKYDSAVASGDSAAINKYGGLLKSAQGNFNDVSGVGDAQAQRDAATAALTDLVKTMTDNQNKILDLTRTQGPQLLAAVAAAASGSIGGQAAFGFQTVGYAGGGLARY